MAARVVPKGIAQTNAEVTAWSPLLAIELTALPQHNELRQLTPQHQLTAELNAPQTGQLTPKLASQAKSS